jgi:hypothetical protein
MDTIWTPEGIFFIYFFLEIWLNFCIIEPVHIVAGVAEQVDATDSKSVGIISCGGSIPFSGITYYKDKG